MSFSSKLDADLAIIINALKTERRVYPRISYYGAALDNLAKHLDSVYHRIITSKHSYNLALEDAQAIVAEITHYPKPMPLNFREAVMSVLMLKPV